MYFIIYIQTRDLFLSRLLERGLEIMGRSGGGLKGIGATNRRGDFFLRFETKKNQE